MKFFTIGHSTRSTEEFINLLKVYRIKILADVRAFPSSSKFPHFNKEYLKTSLLQNDIQYHWLGKELGGYRKKSEGWGERSPNKGWKAEGFRIYADYMLTNGFKNGIEKLLVLAKQGITAYMCAEKFFWRCHRKLISDYLVSRGHEVWHIIEAGHLLMHELPKFAQIKNGVLTYPERKTPSTPTLPFDEESSHHIERKKG
jgi:uncharacterized protein (DUF488 family)